MSKNRFSLDRREYPQTWYMLDVVDRRPRLVGREVVDLSPGAIELRHTARELKGFADERERWLSLDARSRWERAAPGHRRELSFGAVVAYWVEHDERRQVHGGKPIRHLALESGRRLTPATSAEIGLYFYGRKAVTFGFVSPARAHGFVGYGWEPLDGEDIQWLLRREMGKAG